MQRIEGKGAGEADAISEAETTSIFGSLGSVEVRWNAEGQSLAWHKSRT